MLWLCHSLIALPALKVSRRCTVLVPSATLPWPVSPSRKFHRDELAGGKEYNNGNKGRKQLQSQSAPRRSPVGVVPRRRGAHCIDLLPLHDSNFLVKFWVGGGTVLRRSDRNKDADEDVNSDPSDRASSDSYRLDQDAPVTRDALLLRRGMPASARLENLILNTYTTPCRIARA